MQQEENLKLKHKIESLKIELDETRKHCGFMDQKWQQSEAALFDANAEVKIAKAQAFAGEKGRIELEHVNKELLLAGELQLRYQEKLGLLSSMRRSDEELLLAMETYHNEIKSKSIQELLLC